MSSSDPGTVSGRETDDSVSEGLPATAGGLVICQDELLGWVLQSLSKYGKGRGDDEAFWLSAFAGAPIQGMASKSKSRKRKPATRKVATAAPEPHNLGNVAKGSNAY